MRLYYLELLPNGAKIYTCELSERHRIWVEHPNAKEITLKQAQQIQDVIDYSNKNTDNINEK